MSKRCEANASNFNKKRHEKAMAKRAWGTGNSTVEITTESSYCKHPVPALLRRNHPKGLVIWANIMHIICVDTSKIQFESVVTDDK